jgi:anti-anti-sigma factor
LRTVSGAHSHVAVSSRYRRSFRFGPFEVDVQTGELRKNGRRVHLQEKSFQVLVALLEQQGELVSREELRQRLWNLETFVDFDNGLNTAVSKLRDALADSAETHKYIETFARRGYRFVGRVEEFAEAPAATPRELKIQVAQIEPDIVVVAMEGKIVLGPECQQVEWLISNLLAENKQKIVLDISGVTRVDSTGVGIIVVCHGKVKSAGGELRLAGATGMVEKTLRMSTIDSIVAMHPTRTAAVEVFSGTEGHSQDKSKSHE